MSWNAIGSSIPVNRTAGVTMGGGAHYDYVETTESFDSETPLKTRMLPFGNNRHNRLKDHTGTRTGSLTVVGFADGHKQHWVLKCDCGVYTIRRHSRLKKNINGNKTHDCCNKCRALKILKSSNNINI